MELTSRQKEIFDFVRTFIKERGYPPSVREIGEHFNIYPRAVFDHLKALEKKGYLKRRGSMSRGLEVLVFQEYEPYGSLSAGWTLRRRLNERGKATDSGDSHFRKGCSREAYPSGRACGRDDSTSYGMGEREGSFSSESER